MTPSESRPGIARAVALFAGGIAVVLIGLWIQCRFFPCRPCMPPSYHSIDIVDLGQGPQVGWITLEAGKGDHVRWVNHTGKSFHLRLMPNDPANPNGLAPFPELLTGITVAPNETTGYFRVVVSGLPPGTPLKLHYYSDTEPLKGPPGEPGMTVEE